MSNEELLSRVREHQAEPVELWLQMKKFIKILAEKFSDQAELDDLLQESYFGFLKAVKLYDPNTEVPFHAYAAIWIKQSFRRFIENSGKIVRIPSYQVNNVRKYRRMCADFQRDLHRDPTEAEVREAFGVSKDQLDHAALISNIGSLDEPVTDDDENELTLQVADPLDLEETVVDSVYQQELHNTLWPLVDTLPEREAAVIRGRFLEGKTLKQCADELKISVERCRQHELKALKTMRLNRFRKELEQYVDDDIRYPIAVKGGMEKFRSSGMSSTERAAMRSIWYKEQKLKDIL